MDTAAKDKSIEFKRHCRGKRKGEIFVGNTMRGGIPKHLAGLATIRLGDQALDIDGNELDPDQHLPMFVGSADAVAYDRIMMGRFREICRTGKMPATAVA